MAVETPSDRDFACFFCSTGKAKDISATCPNCGHPIDIGRLIEGTSINNYKLDKYINRGFYGATFRAINRIGIPVALKIVPARLYDVQGKSFVEEIEHYSRLG